MDIVLNPRSWQSQAGRAQRLPAPLDWHGLSARLLAAEACRRSLAAAVPSGAGSFGGALGPAPTDAEGAVNPIASGAGKAV